MSSSADSQIAAAAPAPIPGRLPVLRITPPAGWLELDFHELWQARELLYFFIWRDVKVRYKQTVIGAAWAVLQPLMTMVVFTIFFGRLAQMKSDGLPYQVFSLRGLAPVDLFLHRAFECHRYRCRTAARDHQSLFSAARSCRCPRFFPDSWISQSRFSSIFRCSFTFTFCPTRSIVFLPVFLLLAVLTALAVGLWLSALNAIYRDVRYVMPFFFSSGCLLRPCLSRLHSCRQRWRALYGLNPMAGVIEGFRWSLTGTGRPPGMLFAISVGMVLLLLYGGLVYFQKMETTIADVV